LLAAVRNASPQELATTTYGFSDSRYRELLLRYKGRHFPHTLSEADYHQWEELRFQMLNEPGQGRLTIDQYFAELDRLEAGELNDRDRAIVEALREWGDDIVLMGA
jgi:exodeoxyribonuclease I